MRFVNCGMGSFIRMPWKVLNDEGAIRPNGFAVCFNSLKAKRRPVLGAPTPLVAPDAAGILDKLIDRIRVGAMELHPVKSNRYSILSCLRKGSHALFDFPGNHGSKRRVLITDRNIAAAHYLQAGLVQSLLSGYSTDMPELYEDVRPKLYSNDCQKSDP